MKKTYITGCIVSGFTHLPLLKEKEYTAFAVATLLWPVPMLLWSIYIKYLTVGNFQHHRMVKNKLGCYCDQGS